MYLKYGFTSVKSLLKKTHTGSHHPRRGAQQLGRAGGGQATQLCEGSARRGPQVPGSRPPHLHDAQEEGQLRRGGGEGGAQEEIGEVVS